jgi:hypothetical protein
MDPKYLVYGDESVNNNMVTYAIFVYPPSFYTDAVEILNKVKNNNFPDKNIPLHARVLFHKHQREKSQLDFLNDDLVIDLYAQLFEALNKPHFKKIVAFANKNDFPTEVEGDSIKRPIKINDKSLIAFHVTDTSSILAEPRNYFLG